VTQSEKTEIEKIACKNAFCEIAERKQQQKEFNAIYEEKLRIREAKA
jgi:hypothetical protein